MVLSIYIPVWFDLKVYPNTDKVIWIVIYIPVWFDLKYGWERHAQRSKIFTFQYGSI